jgi:hypothetical protein
VSKLGCAQGRIEILSTLERPKSLVVSWLPCALYSSSIGGCATALASPMSVFTSRKGEAIRTWTSPVLGRSLCIRLPQAHFVHSTTMILHIQRAEKGSTLYRRAVNAPQFFITGTARCRSALALLTSYWPRRLQSKSKIFGSQSLIVQVCVQRAVFAQKNPANWTLRSRYPLPPVWPRHRRA